MSSNYALISATTNIKTQAGKIKGIFVSSASATPTLTFYDSQTSTTTKIIDTFTPVSATNYSFFDGINTEDGIYVVVSGTVSCTIYYE